MILAERNHYTSNLLGANCVYVSKNAIVIDWSRKNYFRHCHTLHNVHRYDETSDAEDSTDKDNGSSGKDTNWAWIATQRRLMPTSITASRVRTGPAFVGTSKCTALHGMVSYLHAKNTTGPTLFTYNTFFTKELTAVVTTVSKIASSGLLNIIYNLRN